MLTRLHVSGFKNLVDTEIRFGPFTCIAGLNGVGKSNVLDAIHFLSLLADHTFVDAARQTRGGPDLINLFARTGDERMSFACDMIIPQRGMDDFHQPAEASQTFLRYDLKLQLAKTENDLYRVEVIEERLAAIPRGAIKESLAFSTTAAWRDSVIRSSPRRAPFISMEGKEGEPVVRLSADKMREDDKSKRGGGRPADYLARNLPRTVLSAAQNADEARTAVLARNEMRSWRILQLEPSALRKPDDFQAPTVLGVDGKNLPATLHRLASESSPDRVYAEISNRLSELVDDVRAIRVDRDDTRRSLQLVMVDTAGVELPASSLSDGTLRFVALSVLAHDSAGGGLICLEEPENGIHPERMDAMVALLRDMAVDPTEAVGKDNPLRQVIVSTHSPVVAARVGEEDLVFAARRDAPSASPGALRSLVLRPIAQTWRAKLDVGAVPQGQVIHYLSAVRPDPEEAPRAAGSRTVFARYAGQLDLFGGKV